MHGAGLVAPSGGVTLEIIKKDAWKPAWLRAWRPRTRLGQYIKTVAHRLPRDVALELIHELDGMGFIESSLHLIHRPFQKESIVLGIVGRKKVTDNGVAFIVDAFQNIVELENMKFHGLGTGTNAEAAADTALQTELTTEYNPNSTRVMGTTVEGATANIFRTVGTNTVDASAAVTEHGIFTQAATGGGTLLDRTVFSVVNLANGDSLQSTYEITFTSGS